MARRTREAVALCEAAAADFQGLAAHFQTDWPGDRAFAIGRAFMDAEQLLLERLRGVTLGEVRDDFRRRMHAGGHHILEFHRHDA